MKSRFWIAGAILLVATLAYMFWPRARSEANSQTQEQKTAKNATPSPTSNPAASKVPTLQDEIKRRDAILKNALEGVNVPIVFFGQVVDQNSNSLAGVKIDAWVRRWDPSVPRGSLHIQKETDSSGRFEIQGVTGDAVGIEGIIKEGYELEPGLRSYGSKAGSPENPTIFKMWSTNSHERLIRGEKSFEIVPDGRTYLIDLSKGTISETADGDIKVSLKYAGYGVQITNTEHYDWECEVIAINGGLQLESDLSSAMFTAPIEGYVPTFRLEHQFRGGQRGSSGTKRFYIRLKDGKEYGRINIELLAPFNNQISGLIRLSFVINPSGSRILR